MKGFCRECAQMVRSAVVCPACEGLCQETAQYAQKLEMERLRQRGLFDEIRTIITYPLSDPLAYVLLAIIVWIFYMGSKVAIVGGGYGILFSNGLMMAYAFHAVDRASNGHLKGFMPEISDISELVLPLRMGLFAMISSTWPLIVVMLISPAIMGMNLLRFSDFSLREPVVYAQGETAPPAETPQPGAGETPTYATPLAAEETRIDVHEARSESDAPRSMGSAAELAARGLGVLALLILALLWKVAYSPAALTVAAVARTAGFFSSMIQTLNPLVGIGVIVRMGSIYWQALAIYTVITIARFVAMALFGWIPILGSLIQTFVDTYAWLSIGCTLGLAIFKRARELGLE
jgi:hypothetical protein